MDSFGSRSGEKPVSCIIWPETLDHSCKLTSGSKLGIGGLGERSSGSVPRLGFNGDKSGVGLGRGLSTGEGMQSPHGVIALAQAFNAISSLPMLPKIQVQKCDKCPREFCSVVNYRRHVRGHRKSLHVDKEDLRNERDNLAAFWDKLPEGASKAILDVKFKVEELCGEAITKALERFIQVAAFGFYSSNYFRSGNALIDAVRKQPALTSLELFSLLDEATERTFLSGATSEPVVRYIYQGEAGKSSLEEKNLVASLGFLLEHNLVKAWISDKSEEAKRVLEALEREEDDAHRRHEAILEKRRIKKRKQKEKKGSPLVEENELEADVDVPSPVEEVENSQEERDADRKQTGSESSDHLVAALPFSVTPDNSSQDMDGWQRSGKVKWADDVWPRYSRRNGGRSGLQDDRNKSFRAVFNGLKPEDDYSNSGRHRHKAQRHVKSLNNVVWARKKDPTTLDDATDGEAKAKLPASQAPDAVVAVLERVSSGELAGSHANGLENHSADVASTSSNEDDCLTISIGSLRIPLPGDHRRGHPASVGQLEKAVKVQDMGVDATFVHDCGNSASPGPRSPEKADSDKAATSPPNGSESASGEVSSRPSQVLDTEAIQRFLSERWVAALSDVDTAVFLLPDDGERGYGEAPPEPGGGATPEPGGCGNSTATGTGGAKDRIGSSSKDEKQQRQGKKRWHKRSKAAGGDKEQRYLPKSQ